MAVRATRSAASIAKSFRRKKLVFTAPDSSDRGSTLIFAEEGKKTKLTITIECANSQERDAMLQMRVDAGTAKTLENLAAYLPTIA